MDRSRLSRQHQNPARHQPKAINKCHYDTHESRDKSSKQLDARSVLKVLRSTRSQAVLYPFGLSLVTTTVHTPSHAACEEGCTTYIIEAGHPSLTVPGAQSKSTHHTTCRKNRHTTKHSHDSCASCAGAGAFRTAMPLPLAGSQARIYQQEQCGRTRARPNRSSGSNHPRSHTSPWK